MSINHSHERPHIPRPRNHEHQHTLNPVGLEDQTSFADLVEQGFQANQRFDKFFRHVIVEAWKTSPEMFRETMKRNLDAYMVRVQKEKDFNPETLPHALRRYRQEQQGETEAGDVRPALPTVTIIKNWMSGASRPDATQIAAMAYAFDLTPRQEHMLFKSVQGKRLTLAQVIEAVEKKDGAALGRLLFAASGFNAERLEELTGIPDSTFKKWIDRESPVIPTDDHLQAIPYMAQLLTDCLDVGQKSVLDLHALQDNVADVISGGKIRQRPNREKSAAGEFQRIFEDAFTQGKSFAQFLKQVQSEWGVTTSYLDFINQNNAAGDEPIKHDHSIDSASGEEVPSAIDSASGEEIPSAQNPAGKKFSGDPIKHGRFIEWASGQEVPSAEHIVQVATGSRMNRLQELKLWKMIHGKKITEAEVNGYLDTDHSGVVLRNLAEAAGIKPMRIAQLLEVSHSTYGDWTSQTKPRPVHDMVKANLLADLLLPLIEWGELAPSDAKIQGVRKRFLEVVSKQKTELVDNIDEAAKDGKPHARLFHLLAEKALQSNPVLMRDKRKPNEVLADALQTPMRNVMHFKDGSMIPSEAQARLLIVLSGSGDVRAVTRAVDMLTQTRSPSELLDLAKREEIVIGKVYEEIRKRRNRASRFKDNGKPVTPAIANERADFIGFKGSERCHFIGMATADPEYFALREQLRSPTTFLAIWDEFASHVRKTETKQALETVRTLLSGGDLSGMQDFAVNDACKVVAKAIAHSISPDEALNNKEWHGKVFNAVNTLLYQRVHQRRQRLGLGGIANCAETARHQRDELFKDPEAKRLLGGFISLNDGHVMGMAMGEGAGLKDLHKYADDEMSLWTDMWMGYGGTSGVLRGGVLDSFMRWDPQGCSYSTFSHSAIKWQIGHLRDVAKKEHEQSNRLNDDAADEEAPKPRILDNVAEEQYHDDLREDDDISTAQEVVRKVFAVVAKMSNEREKAVLMKAFAGFMTGEVSKLGDLGGEAGGSGRKVTREAVRLLLARAKEHFAELWAEMFPDDPAPIGLRQFMARAGNSESPGDMSPG